MSCFFKLFFLPNSVGILEYDRRDVFCWQRLIRSYIRKLACFYAYSVQLHFPCNFGENEFFKLTSLIDLCRKYFFKNWLKNFIVTHLDWFKPNPKINSDWQRPNSSHCGTTFWALKFCSIFIPVFPFHCKSLVQAIQWYWGNYYKLQKYCLRVPW